jgi:hypothetical protein
MKILMAAVVMTGLLLSGGLATPASAEVSFGVFYSNLGSHGNWMVSANYGRVWQPAVYRAGWHPYYDGHWVYTDLGWTWVSDYSWGNIAYHYGTWVLDPAYGWVWVPGYTWAPSWVVFRTGGDYIGWAPVPPTFSIGVSFVNVSPTRFVFVSNRDFMSRRIGRHFIPRSRVTTIVNNTRIVNNIRVENNIVVNRGPSVRDIERATRTRIQPAPIERVSRVSPSGRFNRNEIRVDRNRASRSIRAAEPVSAKTALPDRRRETSSRNTRPDRTQERSSVDRKPQDRRSPSASSVRERESDRSTPPSRRATSTVEKRSAPSKTIRQSDRNAPTERRTTTTVDRRKPAPVKPTSSQKARDAQKTRDAEKAREEARARAKKKAKKDENPVRSDLKYGNESSQVAVIAA